MQSQVHFFETRTVRMPFFASSPRSQIAGIERNERAFSYCEFSAAANVERTEAKRWQENGWPAVLTFTDADLIPKPAISLLRIEGSSVSSLDCLKPACVNCLSALKREAPPPNFDTKLQISPSEKQGRWEARECPVLHLV
jgi:hypothetical protein